MNKLFFGVSLLFGIASSVATAAQTIDLPNADFEKGLTGWSAHDNGMSLVRADSAHGGQSGLRVEDRDPAAGSNLYSTTLKAVSGMEYQLQFWGRSLSGEGLAVYMVFYDQNNEALSRSEFNNEIKMTLPGGAKDWKQYTLKGGAPEGAARMKIWIHSFINNVVSADVDDFVLTESAPQ